MTTLSSLIPPVNISTVSGTLAVGNGGTGVTTGTGTGSVVLNTSPTLVTPTLGAASATSTANSLGTVGAPSYTFTGDTNTGMWSPAADTVAVSTAGSERMRVTSTGGITSSDLADAVGYKGLPQNSQGGYTLVLSDMGKHIQLTFGTLTIPANSSVAFPIGTAITIVNGGAGSQTITITSDTLRQAGTSNTGNRTLQPFGIATIIKVTATAWYITGNIT